MSGFWPSVKSAQAAGVLAGDFPYAPRILYVGANVPSFVSNRYNTIKDALAAIKAKEVLLLGPQTYDEPNLVITQSNITIIGTGNRGECSISPSLASASALDIQATGVALYNLDISAGSAGDHAVRAGLNTASSLNRFIARGCKIEGGVKSLHMWGMSDSIIDDCEICWGTNGIMLQANTHGLATEVFIRNCRFHNITTDHICQSANQAEVGALEVRDCIHNNDEAGVAPSHFVNLQHNSNFGIFATNRYAVATNTNSKFVIGTGLKWVANSTEAGGSTARPA